MVLVPFRGAKTPFLKGFLLPQLRQVDEMTHKAKKKRKKRTAATKGSLGPKGSGRPNSQSNRAINPRFATLRTKPDDRIS